MDDTLDLLDVLLDGVTEPRLKLISGDEGRALMVLLGLLDDDTQPEEVRRAAGEMRVRLASRLAGTGDGPVARGTRHVGECAYVRAPAKGSPNSGASAPQFGA
ncbi:hypothetical protein ABZZ20_25615 [Streptomyces sp. NPDC006430]|uniref:hypothetical protein n=1 Tax=Streptomyces sp. NPDC006430 TaxID=3154299 RepID=UPI0033B71ED4